MTEVGKRNPYVRLHPTLRQSCRGASIADLRRVSSALHWQKGGNLPMSKVQTNKGPATHSICPKPDRPRIETHRLHAMLTIQIMRSRDLKRLVHTHRWQPPQNLTGLLDIDLQ